MYCINKKLIKTKFLLEMLACLNQFLIVSLVTIFQDYAQYTNNNIAKMADDVDVDLEVQGYKCNYCKGNVSKKFVTCGTCKKVYHGSCIGRKRGARQTTTPGIVECCLGDKSEVKISEEEPLNMKGSTVDKEKEALLNENYLLRRLVKELEDKNTLLEEKVLALEENFNKTKETALLNKTYSAAVRSCEKDAGVQNECVPKLIIKPKVQQAATITKTEVQKKIRPENLKVGINKVSETKSGAMVVRCKNLHDLDKLQEKMTEELGNSYEIHREELLNPRLKIIGIEEEYSPEELTRTLCSQNNAHQHEIVVKHIARLKNGTYTAYVEVKPNTFAKLMSTKKVLVGWQRCPCYEDLNLNRCFKCKGYRHSAKKCNNNNTCGRCAKEHTDSECNNIEKNCINCVRSNQRYKSKYDTNHSVYDTDRCSTYLLLEKLQHSRINYNF